MSNMIYHKIEYISWKKEAKKIVLSPEEMIKKIKEIKATKHLAKTNTKRSDYINGDTYKIERKGDYVQIYTRDNEEYVIYCNNMVDINKNNQDNSLRPDRLFEQEFVKRNGLTLRKAFGFVDKSLKRCVPKQLYYINESYIGKIVKASGIDASSQYPSGCLGKLPDVHDDLYFNHYVEPTEEYPFAFYASGHIAIYDELDTHKWLGHRLAPNLFRLDKNDDWPLRPLKKEEEHTILMKASKYEMTDVWNYFYNMKQQCQEGTEEYEAAKLVMNKTIGSWHRKDSNKKSIMTYDDHGSYQLAHIVAVAIARGNQKILNKLNEIDPIIPMFSILHICVDGIIYTGAQEFGLPESSFGAFKQEFTNADFIMKAINVYCARKNDHCVKFKHGGYDLLDGQEIDENKDFTFEDLDKLSQKDRVGDYING